MFLSFRAKRAAEAFPFRSFRPIRIGNSGEKLHCFLEVVVRPGLNRLCIIPAAKSFPRRDIQSGEAAIRDEATNCGYRGGIPGREDPRCDLGGWYRSG